MSVHTCRPLWSRPLAQAHAISVTNAQHVTVQGSTRGGPTCDGAAPDLQEDQKWKLARSHVHSSCWLGKTNKASFWNIIHVNLEICSCHLPGCWNSLKDPWPRGLWPHVVPLDHVKESCCVSRLSLPLKGELLGSICWMWCMAALTNTSTVTHWCK